MDMDASLSRGHRHGTGAMPGPAYRISNGTNRSGSIWKRSGSKTSRPDRYKAHSRDLSMIDDACPAKPNLALWKIAILL